VSTIGFLHTSPAHVTTFDRLVADASVGAAVVTLVDESLLARARTLGPDHPTVVGGVRAAIDALAGGGADTIVCTCSTIGAVAEAVGDELDRRVVRVDRPMAERAVELAGDVAGRVLVVAALANTVGPTRDLIASIAAERGASIEVQVRVVAGAWSRFEADDHDGYLAAIAGALEAGADDCDVVVLAQASMADAADRVDIGVPVLSSPWSAVRSLFG
jgi:aspartate/glutamate racemase